jgi:hypothetical protein
MAYLDPIVLGQEYIQALDVPVEYGLLVQIIDPQADFVGPPPNLIFGEMFVF